MPTDGTSTTCTSAEVRAARLRLAMGFKMRAAVTITISIIYQCELLSKAHVPFYRKGEITYNDNHEGGRCKDIEFLLEDERQKREDATADIHCHKRNGETNHFLAFVYFPVLRPTMELENGREIGCITHKRPRAVIAELVMLKSFTGIVFPLLAVG